MINLKRLRDPLVAAVGGLLIAGASVALATNPTASPTPAASTAEDPSGAPDTDTLQEGDQNAPDGAGTEADGAGPDAKDPNYTGKATIPVDESTLPQDEAAEAAALASLATVSQSNAESAALAAVSGTVVKSELGNENGFVVWSIEIRDGAGTTHDVTIDAGNGQVLGTQAGEDSAAE